jgi:octaprenyl-diphosphate synthase
MSSVDSSHFTASRLDSLLGLVEEDLKKVDEVIITYLRNPVSLISDLASHLITSGGKRIRPLLTLASAKICEYRGSHHITLAACIEFIHSATLLHDDVVDESSMRRGVVSAHKIWGNQASILVGDFLFSRAFQLMVEVKSLDILSILSTASAKIAQGEVLQLLTSQNLQTTQEQYLEVVFSKTAKLFEAACEVGAVLGERDAEERKALAAFGRNIGIAFQLIDDILDYKGTERKFGKDKGNDFKEGKITLPVIKALEKASSQEYLFWQRTLGSLQQKEEDFNQALAYLAKHKAIEHTFEEAKIYIEKAQNCLKIFPDSPIKEALKELAYFVLTTAL